MEDFLVIQTQTSDDLREFVWTLFVITRQMVPYFVTENLAVDLIKIRAYQADESYTLVQKIIVPWVHGQEVDQCN